jgi:hypothetical protein
MNWLSGGGERDTIVSGLAFATISNNGHLSWNFGAGSVSPGHYAAVSFVKSLGKDLKKFAKKPIKKLTNRKSFSANCKGGLARVANAWKSKRGLTSFTLTPEDLVDAFRDGDVVLVDGTKVLAPSLPGRLPLVSPSSILSGSSSVNASSPKGQGVIYYDPRRAESSHKSLAKGWGPSRWRVSEASDQVKAVPTFHSSGLSLLREHRAGNAGLAQRVLAISAYLGYSRPDKSGTNRRRFLQSRYS